MNPIKSRDKHLNLKSMKTEVPVELYKSNVTMAPTLTQRKKLGNKLENNTFLNPPEIWDANKLEETKF